jgi:hypothetical protein
VDLIARRFRGVLIAIVVLGISAGAVFAGHVTLQVPASAPTASEQGDQNEQADENDNETPEADDNDGADEQEAPEPPDADTGDTAAEGTHGALVSAAAQMDTPVMLGEGAVQFKNHGEFVSCVAHIKTMPAGMDVAAVLAKVTPDSCAAAAAADKPDKADKADRVHGKSGKHGKGHNRS